MSLRHGTSHFTSRLAAIRYYTSYGYEDVESEVDRKLRDSEIHLGPPLIESGYKLWVDDDGRYFQEYP